jgi:hypothetical protein
MAPSHFSLLIGLGEPSAEINILEPADGNTAQCSLGAAVEAIGDGLGNPIAG